VSCTTLRMFEARVCVASALTPPPPPPSPPMPLGSREEGLSGTHMSGSPPTYIRQEEISIRDCVNPRLFGGCDGA
jgi:hypothetical protein